MTNEEKLNKQNQMGLGGMINNLFGNSSLPFSIFKGRKLVEIIAGENEVFFEIDKGNDLQENIHLQLHHVQDCCEYVDLIKTNGSFSDLIDSEILEAEEDYIDKPSWHTDETNSSESVTWSYYMLKTEKGKIEWWFKGESNGYYSETLVLERIEK